MWLCNQSFFGGSAALLHLLYCTGRNSHQNPAATCRVTQTCIPAQLQLFSSSTVFQHLHNSLSNLSSVTFCNKGTGTLVWWWLSQSTQANQHLAYTCHDPTPGLLQAAPNEQCGRCYYWANRYTCS